MQSGMAVSCLLLLAVAAAAGSDDRTPDPARFLLWGPGLRADLPLPVRYFFVQAVDRAGRNLSEPLPRGLQVRMRASDDQPVPAASRTDYLGRGLYVFRWRLHRSLEDADVLISVSHAGQRVAELSLRRPLLGEMCRCPEANFTAWTERLGCPRAFPQIQRDFRRFPVIHVDGVLEQFLRLFHPESVGACRYILRDNQIFRKCFGRHVGFRTFSDALLLSMARKVALPDMDFIWNLGDWPLSHNASAPLPILSWCGSETTHDVVLPTYEMTESVLEMMGRQSLDVFSVLAQSTEPWHERKGVAFFRGRDSSEERLRLVRTSLTKPGLVDARLTNMFFFKNDSTLGERAPHVRFSDFFKFKYQLNLDGTVAAYRLPFLLAGGSLVLKQASPYYEHFYASLRAGTHFLPLRRDISDLEERLEWLQSHDDDARRIAAAGREFALHSLAPADVYCYYARVFELYSMRMSARPAQESPGPEFERVTTTEYTTPEACDCRRRRDEL